MFDPDNLNLPIQKFDCSVEDGGPFKVIIEEAKGCVSAKSLVDKSSKSRLVNSSRVKDFYSESVNTYCLDGKNIAAVLILATRFGTISLVAKPAIY